ncbi:MAG: hypothetical protein F6J93_38660 [Oscillatoria sp. SIO1A7]|nr:hypothetical protein [Oscillatoria sp. SIO1A7]
MGRNDQDREWGLWGLSGETIPPQCPMPNAQCPMPNAQCPMPNAQFFKRKFKNQFVRQD